MQIILFQRSKRTSIGTFCSEKVTCYEIARYEDHYGSKDRKCRYRSVLESTLCTATPENGTE